MASSYNLATGREAWVTTSPTGNTTVSVRSVEPLKPRAVYVGTARLEFMWVSTGKTTHWQFTPTLLDQTAAQFAQIAPENGQGQVVTVDFGNRMFPATGIVRSNVTGEIRAPAVHFDLPYASDLWVFLLRSPWFPMKVNVEKSPLTIAHDSAQAMAEVNPINFDEGKSLRIDASAHGEGFKRIWVTLKRSVNRASTEEAIGEVTGGNWKLHLETVSEKF